MMLVARPVTAKATKAPTMTSGSAKKITTGTNSEPSRITMSMSR
jgi:hypothetical protein